LGKIIWKLKSKIPVSSKGLIKTSAYNGVATVIRMILGMISNKISSIYLGPSGYAIIGQFSNYSSIATTFASGGISAGIIKYVSEYYDQLDKRDKIIKTSLFIVLICSSIVGILSIALCRVFSVILLKSPQYWSIFVISGLMIILNSIGLVISNLLNALKQMTKLITTQIIMNFVSLGVTIPLVIFYNVYGSLLSVFIIAPLTIFINYRFLQKSGFDFRAVKPLFDRDSFNKLAVFSAMAFTTALLLPVSQIIIRNYIITRISPDSAGYWQGIVKLSDMYMSIIISSLMLYYLPRLSEIKGIRELRKEIFLGYSILIPLMVIIGLTVFFLRDFIIQILYAPSFRPMRELFPFQILGDFFKIASWLLSFLMIAKAKGKMYIVTEILFSVSYLVFSLWFISKNGVIGITYAYSLNNFLYFLVFVYLFRDIVFKNIHESYYKI
jgi:PST family polysaccharide transporter